jgi:DNA-binding NarL/FixJ family response regulator
LTDSTERNSGTNEEPAASQDGKAKTDGLNSPRTAIRLLIVDDHPIVLHGLAAMLSYQPDMAVVAEARTGEEAIVFSERHHPDVTLMDLCLPDMTGVEAMMAIRNSDPDARIIVLTTFKGDIHASRALKAGAFGFLLKGTTRSELLEAIRDVHRGHRYVPGDVAMDMALHVGDEALTGREIEVLHEVAGGNSNKVIAHHLAVSEDTVKTHVRNILFKLSANDRTHAVAIALRRGCFGLLDSGPPGAVVAKDHPI